MDNYVNDKEFLFGADGTGTAQKVVFKKGSLSKAADAAKTGAAGSIIFGKDETDGVGAIWVDGKLVTGKVLDFSHSHNDTTHEGTATFKLLGENGTVDTSTFTFVNAADVAAIQGDISRDVIDLSTRMNTAESDIDSLEGKMDTAESAIAAVETHLEATNITEATNGAVTVTPSIGDGFKTYTVGVNVDSSTVKVVNDKLAVATYTLTKKATADAGLASQYVFTTTPADGGTPTTFTIDIPKDQFLKEAKLVWAKEVEGEWIEEGVTKDTPEAVQCLKFDWQLVDTSAGKAATYIPLKDFASIYKAGTHITIGNDNSISVDVSSLAPAISTALDLSTLFTEIDSSIDSIESWIEGAQTWKGVVDSSISTINTHLAALDTSTKNNAAAIATNATNIATNATDIATIKASYVKSVEAGTASDGKYTVTVTNGDNTTDTFDVPTTYLKTIASNAGTDFATYTITPSEGDATAIAVPTTFVKSFAVDSSASGTGTAFATTDGKETLTLTPSVGDNKVITFASEARVAALEQTLTWMELD